METTRTSEPFSDTDYHELDDDGPKLSNWEFFKKTWPLIRGPRAKLRAIGKLLMRALP